MKLKQTILIVDDDEDLTKTLSERLQFEGYETVVMNSGVNALESITRTKPDLMLLDLMMPAGSGVTVLNIVKSNPFFCSIPLVVMTAIADSLRMEGDIRALGADDFVIKPCDTSSLLMKIRALLPVEKDV